MNGEKDAQPYSKAKHEMSVSVLTYHSHNISGNGYSENDHTALETDIEVLFQEGFRFVSLRRVVEALLNGWNDALLIEAKCIAFTFDDGPVFDFRDFEHSRFGLQKSFGRILQEMNARLPDSADKLCATSFVIASPVARQCMAVSPECGYTDISDWLSDDWWFEAACEGVLDIGNHSWDHVHPVVAEIALTNDTRGNFGDVADMLSADAQIAMANYFIALKTKGRATPYFCYPFGQTNEYLLNEYFPHHQSKHGMLAAFTTGGRPIASGENRWALPRFVCGHHWRSPDELLELVAE
jgi:peptidoglycan/xylan/chitin deacetylase (PgdA/CDA1 family)